MGSLTKNVFLFFQAINWKSHTIFVVALRTNHLVYIVKNEEYKMPIEPLEKFGASETPAGIHMIKEQNQIYCVLSSQISSKSGGIS